MEQRRNLNRVFGSTTSQKDFLEYLTKCVDSRSLNFFLGAGISKKPPSDLPLATEFRADFFEELCTQENYTELYKNYLSKLDSIPFEGFAMSIISDSDFFDCFVRIFSFGKPNKNHELLARLFLKGHLSKALTTNFDALLEQAANSLSERMNLTVLYDERHFDKLDLDSIRTPLICKIHGGIQEPSSVRATLDLIARAELQQSRSKILDYFFRTSGKDVLVLGYSCSDVFDINPFIENLVSRVKILVVKHENTGFRIEKLSKPFERFSGNQIVCNTDIIIDHLWNRFVGTRYEEIKNINQDWRREISEWIHGLNSAQRLYLAGKILLGVSEANKSIELLNQGLNRASNKRLRAHILLSLASAHALRGDYLEAGKLCKECLPMLEEGEDDINIAQCHAFIGRFEKLRGNYDEAEQLLGKSLEICQRIGSSDGTARVLEDMGMMYQRRGDFEKAKESYTKALDSHRKNGNMGGIAGCLHQLGQIARIKGDEKTAKSLFTESLEIYKKLGSSLDIAGSKHELALCELNSGKLDAAQKLFEETLHTLEELNEQARIAWTLHDFGTVFYRRRNYDKAEDLIQRSLEIKRSNNDQKGISESLGMIGLIRMEQGKYDEAEKMLLEAYVISKKLGDRYTMEIALKTLEVLYSRKHDVRKLFQMKKLRASLFGVARALR